MPQKKMPVLHFRAGTVDETIEVMNHFLRRKWADKVLSVYPLLARRLKNVRSAKKKDIIVYSFFKDLEEKTDLKQKARSFQRSWNRINDRAMKALSKVVEADWPSDCASISVRITFCPICPRWLETRNFDVFWLYPNKDMKATALHELLHFIYFEKWKRVFPRIPEEQFNYPHLVWRLSEMVPGAVLGDARIQAVVRHVPKVYTEFDAIEINRVPLLEHIQKFYDERKDFSHFLRNSYAFVQKNRSVIEFTI